MAIRKIPRRDRHLATASGGIQCAATTAQTWIAWNAHGSATTHIFQLDKSCGADGMVVKPGTRVAPGMSFFVPFVAVWSAASSTRYAWPTR